MHVMRGDGHPPTATPMEGRFVRDLRRARPAEFISPKTSPKMVFRRSTAILSTGSRKRPMPRNAASAEVYASIARVRQAFQRHGFRRGSLSCDSGPDSLVARLFRSNRTGAMATSTATSAGANVLPAHEPNQSSCGIAPRKLAAFARSSVVSSGAGSAGRLWPSSRPQFRGGSHDGPAQRHRPAATSRGRRPMTAEPTACMTQTEWVDWKRRRFDGAPGIQEAERRKPDRV